MKRSGDFGDSYVLASGKVLYANKGILGIAPNLLVYEGYDGRVNQTKLTPEEADEIADHAIALWQRFKAENGLERVKGDDIEGGSIPRKVKSATAQEARRRSKQWRVGF